ncbi:hypothetical protein thalar_01322 [Litoreibacter arenae DSM 19593]|uniref:Uncharacterized protein n=1 Tax=Litoreibacter arenae DSM 19593 TaxID=1123360 RepID=S9QEY6_9RHOB|nr:hypothetical protein thalar_01322 [Litoreibacter arenae DSM 19593]
MHLWVVLIQKLMVRPHMPHHKDQLNRYFRLQPALRLHGPEGRVRRN